MEGGPSPREPVEDDLILYASEKNAISESIKTTLEEFLGVAQGCSLLCGDTGSHARKSSCTLG